VKVDVEDAGQKVWDGAEASKSIRYLVMEMLSPEIEAGLPARIIRETDFKAYYINDYELVPSADGTFQYVAPVLDLAVLPLIAEETRGPPVGNQPWHPQHRLTAAGVW
jgi:hypothetical protein